MDSFRFRISGVGTALPVNALSNADLSRELGVEQDWISSRCGIETRYRSSQEETTLTLAVEASRQVLSETPGFHPELVICSTFTPEYPLCPTAPAVATQLGLGPIGAFDINAACSGAAVGFLTAVHFLASGFVKRILLVCSDTPTKFLHDEDQNTRILFGDGAAAMALESAPNCRSRILSWQMGSDGAGSTWFYCPTGGSAQPIATGDEKQTTVKMEGRALFKFAIDLGSRLMIDLCDKAGAKLEDVRHVLVHQANLRIIKGLQEKVPIPADRWAVNISDVGNTSAASIPLALAERMKTHAFHEGDLILTVGFGAGLTWAGFLMQW
jgi:3-oxoacyl-[acyl-carrier-protein] synthase-3